MIGDHLGLSWYDLEELKLKKEFTHDEVMRLISECEYLMYEYNKEKNNLRNKELDEAWQEGYDEGLEDGKDLILTDVIVLLEDFIREVKRL